MGYGLLGIGERVRAVGGRLTFANKLSGGLLVTAVLPAVRTGDRAPASVSTVSS
jgi:glucose-6-phosphate-specific signal transduction histidine kinase